MQLVATGNPVNTYLPSTVHKTHHEPVITLFSVELLKLFLVCLRCASNIFTVIDDMLCLCSKL